MTVVSRAVVAAPSRLETAADASLATHAASGPPPFKRGSDIADPSRAVRRDRMDSPGGIYGTSRPENHEIQSRGMQLRQLFRTASPEGGEQFMLIKPNITVHGHANEFYVVDPSLTIKVTQAGVSILRAPSPGFAPISDALHAMINLDRVGQHLEKRGFTNSAKFAVSNPYFSPSPMSSGPGSGSNSPVSWL